MRYFSNSSITIAGIASLCIGYCIYFDYKRRNDSEFRNKLKQANVEQEKVRKMEANKVQIARMRYIAADLEKIMSEPAPTSMEESEKLFLVILTKNH